MTRQQIWQSIREHFPTAEWLKLADIARLMNLSESSVKKAIEHLPYFVVNSTKLWAIRTVVEFIYSTQEEGGSNDK